MGHTSLPAVARQSWLVAKGREVRCGERPLIMGVVNVTADSFYDGGRYAEPERAIAHAIELAEQGADILDIGAESTRPGAQPVNEEDELARVVPVVAELARRVTAQISVDTTKSRVAQSALDAGASIVNDVSALRWDEKMASVVARSGAAVVLMHMQGTPQTMQTAPMYDDVVAEVARFLGERMQAALEAGIAKTNIVLDPGIGFGKLLEHNLELLNRLQELAMLDRPLLVGVSRKAFIGRMVGRAAEHREWGTAAAVALAVDRGARILRVHDVAMMTDVVKVAAAIGSGARSARQAHDA
ncbi:MAG: dihydropteroate synthase [Nitrospira sp.]|nr:dihydropteroate synthase [Nitrospira sp.]